MQSETYITVVKGGHTSQKGPRELRSAVTVSHRGSVIAWGLNKIPARVLQEFLQARPKSKDKSSPWRAIARAGFAMLGGGGLRGTNQSFVRNSCDEHRTILEIRLSTVLE